MKEKKSTVDVRTLLLLDILIMIFMLISGKPEVTLSSFMLAAAVPVITGLYGVLLCYALLFAGLFVYYQFIFHSAIPVFHSAVFYVIGVFSFIVQRIIPFMLLGTVIQKQKNISEITTALERMHLPKGIILSIAVMFRYFPSITIPRRSESGYRVLIRWLQSLYYGTERGVLKPPHESKTID